MPYEYIGDVNLEYGGYFIDVSEAKKYGYATVVRVTDLDSGCGFEGAVAIEHLTVCFLDDEKRQDNALSAQGLSDDFKMPKKGTKAWYMLIAQAFVDYGYGDPDDGWDNYRSYHREIVQCEKDGPMQYDGWTADLNLKGRSLKRHVQRNHLR